MHTATYKVPGGKLVRVRFAVKDGMVNNLQLSGDFFLAPPEKLALLERFFTGWRLDAVGGEEQLRSRVHKFLQRERIELAGVDAEAFAHVITLAAQSPAVSPSEEPR